MTVATALVSGNDPLPRLAEEAVVQALARSGLTHASGVLLFLTPEFVRHAQQTVTAVARTARCTQVAGGIASGVFTEAGWALDRPAAAVMVFAGGFSLGHPETGNSPLLSYAGGAFPADWNENKTRFGGIFSGNFADSTAPAKPATWQQSRLSGELGCSVQIMGAEVAIGVSSGLQVLGKPQPVERSNGYDLEKLGGQAALKSLNRVLPPEMRQHIAQHLHQLAAVLIGKANNSNNATADEYCHPVAIIAANTDNSLTLSERIFPGQCLAWAIRQPLTAEADMRQSIDRLACNAPDPACALMFSCIGRGPYFYGGEDRDLAVLCARFPGLPVLGIYGTGQIAPANSGIAHGNIQLQNAVVTALVSKHLQEARIQSIR